MKSEKIRHVLRWLARIWGSAIAAIVLFFLVMDLLSGGTAESLSTKEVLTFICFPLSPIIGFILAWKWEFRGGLLVLLGMIGLSFLRPDLLTGFPLIAAIIIPALILTWLGWTSRSKNQDSENRN